MTADVVIVGAGAAGIGAGLALQARGVPFVILEAADRIGGRAYTDTSSLPGQWDQGCGWLHCADVNPLVGWADRLGTVYERDDRGEKVLFWSEGRWLNASERDTVHRSIADRFDAIYEASRQGRDVPISAIPAPEGIGSAFAETLVQLMCSEDPEQASAAGYGDYDDTGVNWVVTSGYGDLIMRMAAGLPIRTSTEVTGVTHHQGGVRVHTRTGTLEARAAIVTVSTNVLRSGRIALPDGPAQQMLELVEGVPCGTYEKIAIALDQAPFDLGDNLGIWMQADAGASPIFFQIAGTKTPLLIAHVAGTDARDLVSAGEEAMTAFAVENLAHAIGSDIRKLICGTAVTRWQTNPFVQGGYSNARPGAAQNRRDMIALDTGAIAFAGEAFSRPWYATAHGAYQSGQDVANRLAGRLIQP
ncbi:MAG: NAD(P)/FAD-dependent oxidoreductase [Albidovulum sp.]